MFTRLAVTADTNTEALRPYLKLFQGMDRARLHVDPTKGTITWDSGNTKVQGANAILKVIDRVRQLGWDNVNSSGRVYNGTYDFEGPDGERLTGYHKITSTKPAAYRGALTLQIKT